MRRDRASVGVRSKVGNVAWELGHRLQSLGVPHAVLDTDELDRVWPQPEPVDALIALTRRTYGQSGATSLVWGRVT